MASHFKSYLHNLNRIRMAELIDHYGVEHRSTTLRPSLIANPLTGLPYNAFQDQLHDVSVEPAG